MAYINGKEILFSPKVNITEGATLKTKSITANGTYNASADNADGYSSVTVNVPSSGGGGDIIEVDVLPEVGEEGKIYKVNNFTGDVINYEGEIYENFLSILGNGNGYYITVDAKPTENIQESGKERWYWYYVKDENDIFMYANLSGDGAAWCSYIEIINGLGVSVDITFMGEISDISQATENGYYALCASMYAQYVNGAWQEYIMPSGSVTVTENGTTDVTNYAKVIVETPLPEGTVDITENGEYNVYSYESVNAAVSTTYIVETVDDLPTDAPACSMAIVLRG